jgi:hypothetical protein
MLYCTLIILRVAHLLVLLHLTSELLLPLTELPLPIPARKQGTKAIDKGQSIQHRNPEYKTANTAAATLEGSY